MNNEELKLYTIQDETDNQTVTPEDLSLASSSIQAGGMVKLAQGSFQSANFGTGVQGWQLLPNGDLEANDGNFRGDITGASGTFTGTITATTGNIGGWTINSTSIYTGTEDHSGYTTNAGDITLYSDGADASIHAKNWYIDTSGNFNTTAGTMSGVSIASIPNDTSTDISLLEFTHSLVFSSTDADTIAWASGTINLSNGRTFSISSGNTGNMAALTYIYLDTGVSSTVLQTTTTFSTAIGANKILVAAAKNNTITASVIVYGGGQPLIDGQQIGAASIVAGNIAALTITAAQIAANTITAAKITAGTITTTEIAATTIVGSNINTLDLTSKTLTADTGTIGGWTLAAHRLSSGSAGTTVGFDNTVTAGDDVRIFAGSATMASAPFRVTEAGALTATSATITGGITATSGGIGGWTINSTSIYTGTEDHSAYTANAGDLTIYSDGADASIHAKNFYIDTAGVLNCTAAVISGGITTTAGSSVDVTYLSGAIASANVNLAARGWIQTSAFSVTDADTIAWGAGTFTASDGTAYSISSGNTGNMAAKTYVYLDIAASTTAYQHTTTAATAVGDGKVLVAICQNATNEAVFMLLNNNSYNIDAANIVTGSITANEIAASTITGAKIAASTITSGLISVSQLSAIAADLGTITAGSISINGGVASIDSAGVGTFSNISITGQTTSTLFVPLSKTYTAGEALSTNDAVYVNSGVTSNTYSASLASASSQYFSHADNASLSLTSDFTLECWVKGVSWPTTMFIDKTAYRFYYTGGNTLHLDTDVGKSVSWTASTGVWYHVAVTYNATSKDTKFYVDGVQQGSTQNGQLAPTDTADSFSIGADSTGAIDFMNGQIDDVRIWSVVRTAAQILANKGVQLSGSPANLVSNWTLNNVLTDTTTSANTLTNHNTATFTSNVPYTNAGTAGRVYQARADSVGKFESFVGFVVAGVSSGATATVLESGAITGFSGLTAGTPYYLSDTPGAISTTAGSNTRKVGISTTTSELLLTNIW